jgi:uncharacterized membrane protein YdjX (TVP38/TMEM64 family)
MRNRKILNLQNFNQKMSAFLIIFIFIALLLTFKPIIELLRKIVETLGGSLPATELIQNTAANLLLLGVGAFVILIAIKVTVPLFAFMLIAGGATIMAVAAYNVYRTFTKQSVQDILPKQDIIRK